MTTNALLTPSIITKETLEILENNLVMAGKVNRQFENQFAKIGQTLTIRKPNKFLITIGPGLSLQNITEPQVSITVNTQAQVAFQFSSAELTLTIEEFSERYCKPAAVKIANYIDQQVYLNYTSFSNLVGAYGTLPATFSALGAVGQRLDELAAPQNDRVLVLTPAAYWSLANGFNNLYVTKVSESALKGFLANIANFMIFMDQNALQAHTYGTLAGTPVVNGAGQTGSSIVTNGWTASSAILNQGDVINFAGVNQTNPESLISTGSLKGFVVTAAVTADSGGNATIPIFPGLTTTGAFQNSSASPANGAAVTFPGTPTGSTAYFNNFGFCRDAIGLVTVPLELPDGVDFRAREMWKGVSMRMIRAYDINSDVFPLRVDVLFGTAQYYDDLGVRMAQ